MSYKALKYLLGFVISVCLAGLIVVVTLPNIEWWRKAVVITIDLILVVVWLFALKSVVAKEKEQKAREGILKDSKRIGQQKKRRL